MLRCQYALLSEFVREGQRNTLDVLGIFDRIFVRSLPSQREQLALVFLLVADSEDDLGKHPFRLRFLTPGGKLIFEQSSTFEVRAEAGTWLGSARLLFRIRSVPLTEHGKYRFRLDVDGEEIADHPLTVAPENAAK